MNINQLKQEMLEKIKNFRKMCRDSLLKIEAYTHIFVFLIQ
jgi:hypothetical protein